MGILTPFPPTNRMTPRLRRLQLDTKILPAAADRHPPPPCPPHQPQSFLLPYQVHRRRSHQSATRWLVVSAARPFGFLLLVVVAFVVRLLLLGAAIASILFHLPPRISTTTTPPMYKVLARRQTHETRYSTRAVLTPTTIVAPQPKGLRRSASKYRAAGTPNKGRCIVVCFEIPFLWHCFLSTFDGTRTRASARVIGWCGRGNDEAKKIEPIRRQRHGARSRVATRTNVSTKQPQHSYKGLCDSERSIKTKQDNNMSYYNNNGGSSSYSGGGGNSYSGGGSGYGDSSYHRYVCDSRRFSHADLLIVLLFSASLCSIPL
jgi:uncharacterized membrane protein YgcG